MSEMVKHVAQAIAAQRRGVPVDWDEMFPEDQAQLMSDARAAIEALMEPDEKMLEAGTKRDEELEWQSSDKAVPDIWRTMLKTALGEKD